jgi:hypothetical protein
MAGGGFGHYCSAQQISQTPPSPGKVTLFLAESRDWNTGIAWQRARQKAQNLSSATINYNKIIADAYQMGSISLLAHRCADWVRGKSVIQGVAAHIRQAKAADHAARISDFQIRVEADRTALINLKTGDVRILPASRSEDRFVEYCEWAERQDCGQNAFR